jgi:CRISPR-associated protein Cas1
MESDGSSLGCLCPDGLQPADFSGLQRRRLDDPGFCLALSREVVAAKIHNSRVLLSRNQVRQQGLEDLAGRAGNAADLDELRGFEGAAARMYFQALSGLVRPFEFAGRSYRPPLGPVNAMLSFGYTLLYNRLALSLSARGLDPRLGFYHQGRGRHFALASDMMEELRHVAERVTLALIHRGEVAPEGFRDKGEQGCFMEHETCRTFIRRFETVMGTPYTVNGGEETLNQRCDRMAAALCRCMEGKEAYRSVRIR